MSTIKIPGNSSAKIEIVKDSLGNLVLEKTCLGTDADRLLIQAEKQKKFVSFDGVRAPKIISIEKRDKETKVIMEYVNGVDFVSFTNTCQRDDFTKVIKKIISLIDREFSDSIESDFPEDIWKLKAISSIDNSRLDDLTKENLRLELLKNLPKKIPLGVCHGDLTFSNCLIESTNNICVFDFLNSPVETPYEDVAKFLQDAQFLWSLHKFNGRCDETRIKVYWHYAESLLKSSIKDKCDFNLLRKFQILGLLRIIPYTHSEVTLEFLSSSIKRLLNDSCITVCR